MNILITGGVGFIGSNTAINFSKKNQNRITLVDNFSRANVDKNAEFLKKNYPGIKIIKSDVGNLKNYKKELNKADVVIHLAGQTAVTTSVSNPAIDFNSNLKSGFLLLNEIRKSNPQAIFIYSSTNKVYGDVPSPTRTQLSSGFDETTPLNFISPYGCSKGAFDAYALDYHRIYGLKTVVFRQSCIYGKRQFGVEDQGWVAHFSKQFLFRKPITIFGSGRQIRDLLYVEDLIEAYELAIKNINKISGQAFNIGGGPKNAYNLITVIKQLEKVYGHKVKIIYKKQRPGDQDFYVSNNKKLKDKLHWQAKTDFKAGIKELINWQKDNL